MVDDADAVVVFLHIPKTGGLSLRHLAGRNYPPGSVLACDLRDPEDLERFWALSEEQKARVRCLVGHVAYGVHENFSRPTSYVTLMRDPVERFLSEYFNYLRAPHRAEQIGIPRSGLKSVEEFVRVQVDRQAMNFQTRQISGLMDLRRPRAPYQPPLSRASLELARRRVDQDFLSVGVTERFDESAALIGHALGWRGLVARRKNVRRPDDPATAVSLRVRERIAQHNELDLELYRHSSERLSESLRARSLPFRTKLAATRHTNRALFVLQRLHHRVGGSRRSSGKGSGDG